MGYLDLAKEEGGTILCGGQSVSPGGDLDGGYYLSPAVVEGLPNHCRTNQEEIFGPVVTIQPFDTEEEAIAIGNDVDFGLAAGVWTQDIGRALRMSEKLRVGTVWVNTYRAVSFTSPFGGYKRSGLGRESGIEAIKQFMEVKSVWIAQQTSVANPFVMR